MTKLAASPADRQVAALPEFVHVPDEVALTYNNAFALPQARDAGYLTAEQSEALARLDRLYDEMSDAPDKETVWTQEAMRADERWRTSRALASAALATLDDAR